MKTLLFKLFVTSLLLILATVVNAQDSLIFVVDGVAVKGVQFDEDPAFPGGKWKMYDYFTYAVRPDAFEQAQLEGDALTGDVGSGTGSIILDFDLDTMGHVHNVYASQSSSMTMDVKFVDAVRKMPPWHSAVLNGRPVEVHIVLPLVYYLSPGGLLEFDPNSMKIVEGSTKKAWWLKAILAVGTLGLIAVLLLGN